MNEVKEPAENMTDAEWADVVADIPDEETIGWYYGWYAAWLNRLGRWTYETCTDLAHSDLIEHANEEAARAYVASWKVERSRKPLADVELRPGWDTNVLRARAALEVVRAFAAMSGQYETAVALGNAEEDDASAEEVIGDLMANLIHLARWHGVDADRLIQVARFHFDEEVEEEDVDAEVGA